MKVGPPGDASAEAIAVRGDTVYVGGTFGTLGGKTHANLGAVSRTTGRPLDVRYDEAAQFDDVWEVIVAGGQVVISGKGPVAAFNAGSGRNLSWPKRIAGAASAFAAVARTLYVGGSASSSFNRIGLTRVANLAAVHLPDGRVMPWHPPVASGTNVSSIAISGRNVLVCGEIHLKGRP